MSQTAVKPIEFKSSSVAAVLVILRSVDMDELELALAAACGGKRRFFDNDAAVFDLAGIPQQQSPHWPGLLTLVHEFGLQPLAIANASADQVLAAAEVGLHPLSDDALAKNSGRKTAPSPAPVPPVVAAAAAEPEQLAPPPAPVQQAAMVVDKPLRSGQRVYAKGCDLIVTAMVSAGAEVIADGSIHVYAPLRGRALAGATGNPDARIFATCFEAELVSIDGVYRTFEQGLPSNLAGQPVQIRLGRVGERRADGGGNLMLEALGLR